jgi:transposase
MERTGVDWKPIWNLLEEEFALLLVNARHVKAVPGRKTDVRDCEWLADLLRHGLLSGSFVPDRPRRELRELTRYRTSLVPERCAEINRLQKTWEGANSKLGDVATDIMGLASRPMLAALVGGETDAAAMAQLAQGRLRDKRPELERALAGRIGPHQRFLLARHQAHIDFLDAAIAEVSAEIAQRRQSCADALERLATIPGIGRRTAEVLIAEIGTDMSRFPTAGHLLSWAGLCPRNDESAGKRRSTRLRKGAPWLKTTLVQCAWAATHKKASYLQAQFQRLRARRGPKKAICAVAASILAAAYRMLRNGTFYQDLGPDHFGHRGRGDRTARLVKQLTALGYIVQPPAPVAPA